MQSEWSDQEASNYIEHYAKQDINADLALRVYTSRLLGQCPELVLHGGGNTSVKTEAKDLFGNKTRVLCVKGSGWDLAFIEPEGLPAIELAPLLKTRVLAELSDEEMVRYHRTHLIDFQAPTPSIETLLHAFLPHKYVDHTHANAILSITNQANSLQICQDIYGDTFGIVKYIKPGFDLAKLAIEIFEQNSQVKGLILLNHGIFTFADTAKLAYERMIETVDLADKYIARKKISSKGGGGTEFHSSVIGVDAATLAPIIRGACSYLIDKEQSHYHRFVITFRTSKNILDYISGTEVARYSQVGVITPDHIIRTKNKPLLLPEIKTTDLAEISQIVLQAVQQYQLTYDHYFEKYNCPNNPKIKLDNMPRVILVPGLGLFTLGNDLKSAHVVADIAENTISTINNAERIGEYNCLPESDLFAIEYWSLEQVKLQKQQPKPLSGQVAIVTGGAGTIGIAIAKLLHNQGAEVAILDEDNDKLNEINQSLSCGMLGISCDVTQADDVENAFKNVCQVFGGVDIVISNAGAAWQGKIGEVSDEILRSSFEVNFFAHQLVAKQAVKIFLQQNIGGNLLFNVSKQAVQPGKNLGPYGLPKAATLSLVRQYALEYGSDGIRVNAVNADRIRSGILTEDMISSRAEAREVDLDTYMSGNLLNLEVKAEDVARAFLYQILSCKTTANVTTVDGGNIAAALR